MKIRHAGPRALAATLSMTLSMAIKSEKQRGWLEGGVHDGQVQFKFHPACCAGRESREKGAESLRGTGGRVSDMD